jgi:hypothetical protein
MPAAVLWKPEKDLRNIFGVKNWFLFLAFS